MSSSDSSKPADAPPTSVASDKVEYVVAELKPMSHQEQPDAKVEINPAVLEDVQEPTLTLEPDAKKLPDKLVKLPAGSRRSATVVNLKRTDLPLPEESPPASSPGSLPSEAASYVEPVVEDAGETGDALSSDEVVESVPPPKRRVGMVVVGMITLAGAAVIGLAVMKRGNGDSAAKASSPNSAAAVNTAPATVSTTAATETATATAEAQPAVTPSVSAAEDPLAQQASAQASEAASALSASASSIVAAAPTARATPAPGAGPRAAAPRPRAPAPPAKPAAPKTYNPTDL